MEISRNAIKCEITFNAGNHNPNDMMEEKLFSRNSSHFCAMKKANWFEKYLQTEPSRKSALAVDVVSDFTFFFYEFKFKTFHHIMRRRKSFNFYLSLSL